MGVIVGTFLACCLPFFIVNIIAGLCKECIDPLWFKVRRDLLLLLALIKLKQIPGMYLLHSFYIEEQNRSLGHTLDISFKVIQSGISSIYEPNYTKLTTTPACHLHRTLSFPILKNFHIFHIHPSIPIFHSLSLTSLNTRTADQATSFIP